MPMASIAWVKRGEILVARQAMVAVLDQGQHHRIAGEMFDERHGMLPRDVFVPHALQNMDGAMGPDRGAEEEMAPPLFDQRAVMG